MKTLLFSIGIASLFVFLANTNARTATKQVKTVQTTTKPSNYAKIARYVKSKEKFVATVYKCQAGKRTIGYGHVLRKGERFTKISKRQADSLFLLDFQKHYNYVLRCGVKNRDTALVLASFSFNCGEKALRKVAKNPHKIKYYVYAKGKKSRGLVIRRNEELKLLARG